MYGLSREETGRAFLFVFFWLLFTLLSAILVAALLTEWPGFLHGPANSSYGAAIHNHDLAVHETIAVRDHERGVLRQFLGLAESSV